MGKPCIFNRPSRHFCIHRPFIIGLHKFLDHPLHLFVYIDFWTDCCICTDQPQIAQCSALICIKCCRRPLVRLLFNGDNIIIRNRKHLRRGQFPSFVDKRTFLIFFEYRNNYAVIGKRNKRMHPFSWIIFFNDREKKGAYFDEFGDRFQLLQRNTLPILYIVEPISAIRTSFIRRRPKRKVTIGTSKLCHKQFPFRAFCNSLFRGYC